MHHGLALTPDAHWMFDKGLWTAIPQGDDFIIHVAIGSYTESTAHSEFLVRHHGRPLHFHPNAKLRAAVEHLGWHERERFLAWASRDPHRPQRPDACASRSSGAREL